VTLRAGAAALPYLYGAGFDTSKEYRVVGAGFGGQDDGDSDLTTPWVEFFRGGYYENGTLTSFPSTSSTPTSDEVHACLYTLEGTYLYGRASDVTFTGSSATVPLIAASSTRPGDQFWADGVKVGGEVTKVEARRFKVGTLSAERSTFDADGSVSVRVYDPYEVASPLHGTPFSPKYAYFVAGGLRYGKVSPAGVAATVTGEAVARSARAAMVQTDVLTFPLNPAGLTLLYTLTVDGVEGEQETLTLTGGPYADADALAASMSIDGVAISGYGGRVVFATEATGRTQSLTIHAGGTANAVLGFSADVDTSDTGKDPELCAAASVTGLPFTLPMPFMEGLALELTVVDSKGTHVVTGEMAADDMSDVDTLVSALSEWLGGDGTSTINDGGIPVAEILGATTDGSTILTVRTLEGGENVSISLKATSEADAFRLLGFYDTDGGEAAELVAEAVMSSFAGIEGDVIELAYEDDESDWTFTYTGSAAMGDATSAEELVVLLNQTSALTTKDTKRRLLWFVDVGGEIGVRGLTGGTDTYIWVSAANAGMDTMLFDVATDVEQQGSTGTNAADAGADTLNGLEFVLYLDSCPTEYSVSCPSNSVQELAEEVNTLVAGDAVIASVVSRSLKITSAFAGAASSVLVEAGGGSAGEALGFSGTRVVGSGRPNPDFYVDADGALNIGPMILREKVQGTPFDVSSTARLYLGYTALRKDLTALGSGWQFFSDATALADALGPLDTRNPLGLAASLAFVASANQGVYALGVDEANAAAPDGTLDALTRALSYLESKTPYALAVVTGDKYLNQASALHVTEMSKPANRNEMIAIIWSEVPERASDTSVVTGEGGRTIGQTNVFVLDESPSANLATIGIANGPVAYDEDLFVEITLALEGTTQVRRYSVSNVNNTALTLRTTFTASQNTDGFYSTTELTEELTDAVYGLYQRGSLALITGTTRKDYDTIAATAGAEAEPFSSKRVVYLFHGDIEVSVDGTVERVPGKYATAIVAAQACARPVQDPLTFVPLPGVGKVYGSADFSENQLDVVSDAGRYVLINRNSAVSSRHQYTTDTSTVANGELSIIRQIDGLSREIREAVVGKTGSSNLTTGLLNEIGMTIQAICGARVARGELRTAEPPVVTVDPDRADHVLVKLTVLPTYPCNKITVTIYS